MVCDYRMLTLMTTMTKTWKLGNLRSGYRKIIRFISQGTTQTVDQVSIARRM